MENNLILIGMPGCGKSTCGVLAAKALCKDFSDTDILIQQREHSGLQDIISEKGSDYFAHIENTILCDFNMTNCVVATGGSAVYATQGMNHLKNGGITVYLEISYEEMRRRVQNIHTRGILLHNGETLEQMYRNRTELYRKYADVVIPCDSLSVEKTVEKICKVVINE